MCRVQSQIFDAAVPLFKEIDELVERAVSLSEPEEQGQLREQLARGVLEFGVAMVASWKDFSGVARCAPLSGIEVVWPDTRTTWESRWFGVTPAAPVADASTERPPEGGPKAA